MLENASPLKQTALGSALAGTSMLRPRAGAKVRRNVVASLMLTSLVDAFSILVIFLIMNHAANNESVDVGAKVNLPQAHASELIQEGVVVRLEGGQILVDNKVVAKNDLINQLKSMQSTVAQARREGLILVADRTMDYAELSPVILAGSQAGFTKFKFAVIRHD